MHDVVIKFLQDVLADIYSTAPSGQLQAFTDLFHASFFFEKIIPMGEETMTGMNFYAAFEAAYWTLYGILLVILVVKILQRGFMVYELGRDGDAEVGPESMVLGGVAAVVITAAFPELYRIFANTVVYLTDKVISIFQALGLLEAEEMPDTIGGLISEIINGTLHNAGTGAVFGIMFMVLYFMLLGRGVELLIFRLGIPLAAIGLVNTDGGIWKTYIQLLFKTAALSITQVFCISLAILVLIAGSMILGLAFLITGICAPKLLSQMFPSQGGGRLTQTVYLASSIGRLITH